MKTAAIPPKVLDPPAAPGPAAADRAPVARRMDRPRYAEVWLVLGLCGAALAARSIAMWLTVDEPGDGPSHAAWAHAWSKRPSLVMHGVWLPGFTYCAGVAMWLVDNPLLIPRLVNLGFGTLTVPVLYALARRLFGPSVAVLSAAALVVLPLHVGLSASSLTEPSFLFFTVAGLTALAWATPGTDAERVALALSLGCFVVAETIRYEVWPLVPLVVAYLMRLRSAAVVVLASVLLLAFPAAWSAGNYMAFHDPLYGLRRGVQPLEDGGAVPASIAIINVARQATQHLGWPLSVAALAGLLAELARTARRTISAERVGYAVLVLAVWVLILGGARSVGTALYDRYLLCGYALLLPFAAATYMRYCGRYRHCISIGVLVSLASVIGAYCTYHPRMWVTRAEPTDIIEVARWLAHTRYRNDAVLMTRMEWRSTYVPLYLPQLHDDRCIIVSAWVDDGMLQRFIRDRKPTLLITQAGDAPYRARVERLLGRDITPDSRVFGAGAVEAYDISGALPPY